MPAPYFSDQEHYEKVIKLEEQRAKKELAAAKALEEEYIKQAIERSKKRDW